MRGIIPITTSHQMNFNTRFCGKPQYSDRSASCSLTRDRSAVMAVERPNMLHPNSRRIRNRKISCNQSCWTVGLMVVLDCQIEMIHISDGRVMLTNKFNSLVLYRCFCVSSWFPIHHIFCNLIVLLNETSMLLLDFQFQA